MKWKSYKSTKLVLQSSNLAGSAKLKARYANWQSSNPKKVVNGSSNLLLVTMSTPKDKVIPGTKVVVDNRGTGVNSPVVLMDRPGEGLSGYTVLVVGEELEILSKPKRSDGINCVKVRYKDAELFAYYCMIRYSTTPV